MDTRGFRVAFTQTTQIRNVLRAPFLPCGTLLTSFLPPFRRSFSSASFCQTHGDIHLLFEPPRRLAQSFETFTESFGTNQYLFAYTHRSQ
ncbi:hypothetical protein KC330_g88 [Hortaea werneckii]|nr:hypothetical protein KC330_g88 [Hortaea werneckii]